MSTLQDDLDKISRLQGKDVQRGDFIAGFGGPDDPPAPPPPVVSAAEMYGNPIEPEYDDEADKTEPPSPLIPPRLLAPEPPKQELPKFDLMVLDAAATYRSRDVLLNEKERAAISKVVLGAIARTLKEQIEEVTALLPKRKRAARGRIQAAAGADQGVGAGESGTAGVNAGRRRGRPPKH